MAKKGKGKGKGKGGKRKRSKSAKPKSAPPPKKGEEKKAEDPAASKASGGLVDPDNNASHPSNAEARQKKVDKNRQAIEHIVMMLQSIPPDQISNATKSDLIEIHKLARGIVARYVKVEDVNKDGKGGGGAAPAEGSKDGGGAKGEGEALKLGAVMPAFADIAWATVTEDEPPAGAGKEEKKDEEKKEETKSKDGKSISGKSKGGKTEGKSGG